MLNPAVHEYYAGLVRTFPWVDVPSDAGRAKNLFIAFSTLAAIGKLDDRGFDHMEVAARLALWTLEGVEPSQERVVELMHRAAPMYLRHRYSVRASPGHMSCAAPAADVSLAGSAK